MALEFTKTFNINLLLTVNGNKKKLLILALFQYMEY